MRNSKLFLSQTLLESCKNCLFHTFLCQQARFEEIEKDVYSLALNQEVRQIFIVHVALKLDNHAQ